MKQINRLIRSLDKWQQRHKPTAFIYAVIKKYGDDQTGYKAALLTYYSFLSLFPLLLVLTTVTNILIGKNPQLAAEVTQGLTNYFPLLGQQLSSHVHTMRGTGLALLAGVLLTLYGARGVADVFRRDVQDMWGVPKKQRAGFPKSVYKSLTLIVVGGLGFLLASISTSYTAAAGRGMGFYLLSLAVNLFILYWLFTFLLNFTLPRHVKAAQLRVGALSAAIGLVILQNAGALVLAHQLKSLDALYSYFAIALGLLFWIYLQAQMFYYSVQIANVSAHKLWPRSFSESTSHND